METSQQIIKTIIDAKTPLRLNEIAEKIGIDKKEIEKVIKVLVTESKIYSPKRCFYDVKK